MKPAVFAWLALGGVAFADDIGIDKLGGQISELDAKVAKLNADLKPPPEPGPELAERRLIDAQVLYELKNYEAASIILFDVVEKFPQSQAYPEALYYLADSLYLKRDFLSSRRYFEKIVEVGTSNPRYPEALQRLIELSLHTGDYSPVDGYIAKLDAVSVTKQLPSVPYVKGKYFYFRKQFDKALESFKGITPTHIYFFHATYFVGAAYVAQGVDHYDDAIAAFSTITKTEAKTASQKLITELAHMALARIYLERAQLTQALAEYKAIGRKSDSFNDMLYESAWVAIKGKDYVKARRQLDLLLLNAPDSPLAPEVKLLMGALNIRNQEYGPATDSFTKTRDEFEPIYKLLEGEVKKSGNTPQYFQALIQKNIDKFDVARILPQETIRWVKDEADVQRLSTLVNDESDLRRSLKDAEKIVHLLEKALNGPARVNVFPDLASARAKAAEVSNALTEAKQKLASQESKLISPVVGSQKAELDSLSTERSRLEALLQTLPAKAAALQEQQAKAKSALNDLDKQASDLAVEVSVLEKTMTAMRNRYRDAVKEPAPPTADEPQAQPPTSDPGMTSYTAKADEMSKRIGGTKGDIDKTKKRVEALKELIYTKPKDAKYELDAVGVEVDKLHAAVEMVRRDILEAAGSIGVDDSAMQAAAKVRVEYEELLKKQHVLVVEVQSRLSSNDRDQSQRIQSILDRARAVDAKIAGFNQRIDEILDVKLKGVQQELLEEKAKIAGFQGTLGGYTGETTETGGAVVADSLRVVADRFYNVVVRADVGIIDVAWALKESSSHNGAAMVAEQKRELKLLDDEFKEVLKEQP